MACAISSCHLWSGEGGFEPPRAVSQNFTSPRPSRPRRHRDDGQGRLEEVTGSTCCNKCDTRKKGPTGGPEPIRPGMPLIVTEGELDALLLGHELADFESVATLGSASSRPEVSTYLAMLRCRRWFAAHDADEAGDRAAAEWPDRAVRGRPAVPDNDWTEAHQSGVNLRR